MVAQSDPSDWGNGCVRNGWIYYLAREALARSALMRHLPQTGTTERMATIDGYVPQGVNSLTVSPDAFYLICAQQGRASADIVMVRIAGSSKH